MCASVVIPTLRGFAVGLGFFCYHLDVVCFNPVVDMILFSTECSHMLLTPHL